MELRSHNTPEEPRLVDGKQVVRLWTFQRRCVVKSFESQTRYLGRWETTPENFRLAYRWMAKLMERRTGVGCRGAPIWCWHSCQRLGSGPTVKTADMLFGKWDLEQGLVTLELLVPSELTVLSSYHLWNDFLDFTMSTGQLPNEDLAQVMFREPLLRHENDDIQAVIPYIDKKWIVDVRPLVVAGRDWFEDV